MISLQNIEKTKCGLNRTCYISYAFDVFSSFQDVSNKIRVPNKNNKKQGDFHGMSYLPSPLLLSLLPSAIEKLGTRDFVDAMAPEAPAIRDFKM